ncbi:MAG: hypothetical protein RL318_1324 [Fibrobacterota bacterium]|jgi:uncharacterized protein (TIGR02145 family)
MRFCSLLIAPSLALCGTFSGTVVSLDGTPVVGAVIKAGTDSVTTTANGTWTLARTTGIASRSGKTIASTSLSASSVTSHLTVENGRPRLSFGGMDLLGRAHASGSPAGAKGGVEGRQAITGRTAAERDTLHIYWKGKRLTVLTVPGDTNDVVFKIDTAWKDDAGIPWNPRIAYGSLLDARDGQTYRTVTIGNRTWMAENLNRRVDSSWLPVSDADSTRRFGRLYNWAAAAELAMSCQTTLCAARLKAAPIGVCPSNWHLPDSTAWATLDSAAQVLPETGKSKAGIALKATSGWAYATSYKGLDLLGFRALAHKTDGASFWTATESGAEYAKGFGLASDMDYGYLGTKTKASRASVRCIKD